MSGTGHADWLLVAGSGLLAFCVYVLTLSRGVLGGDAGELQFVPPILGLTHPTGYPLQVLTHYAWSQIAVGSVAYRLNLLDAGFAAAAVGLVVALARSLGMGRAAAVLAGLSLAFGELWWSQAVRGDKYTLNGLFLAAVLLLFVRWQTRPGFARLAALACVFGLSLAHHRSMLLVAPALAAGVILSRWRPWTLRECLQVPALLALMAAPLALYAYVPWAGARGLPPGSWPVDTPSAFVEFLLDRGYTSQLRPDAAFSGRLLEEAWVLVRSFGPLGAALGLVGLVTLLRRDRVNGIVLLLAFLPQAVLGASYLLESHYRLPRHWVFYLPGFLIWSIWLGVGLDRVLHVLRPRFVRYGWLGPAGLLATVLLVQAGSAWSRGAIMLVRAEAGAETMDDWRQDFQRSPVAERFGRLAFELALPQSIIVCDWEQATVLWYLQRVEGSRPDVTIVYPIERVYQLLEQGDQTDRPLYLARTLPGIETVAATSSVGPLLKLRSLAPSPAGQPPTSVNGIEPAAYEPPAREVHVSFADNVSMVSIAVHAERLQPGSVIPFTIFWSFQPTQLEPHLAEDYAVSVRLLSSEGAILATHDERHPALGTSPTSDWRPHELVGDYHELPLGSRLRPGVYWLQIVPYRVEPREPLAVERILELPGQPMQPATEGVRMPVHLEPRTSGTLLERLTTFTIR